MSERIIEFEDFYITYEMYNGIEIDVFKAVLDYYIKSQTFQGEVIMQDDYAIIEAPEFLSEIADNIFKFKYHNKE